MFHTVFINFMHTVLNIRDYPDFFEFSCLTRFFQFCFSHIPLECCFKADQVSRETDPNIPLWVSHQKWATNWMVLGVPHFHKNHSCASHVWVCLKIPKIRWTTSFSSLERAINWDIKPIFRQTQVSHICIYVVCI